jgi:hypothetical protein
VVLVDLGRHRLVDRQLLPEHRKAQDQLTLVEPGCKERLALGLRMVHLVLDLGLRKGRRERERGHIGLEGDLGRIDLGVLVTRRVMEDHRIGLEAPEIHRVMEDRHIDLVEQENPNRTGQAAEKPRPNVADTGPVESAGHTERILAGEELHHIGLEVDHIEVDHRSRPAAVVGHTIVHIHLVYLAGSIRLVDRGFRECMGELVVRPEHRRRLEEEDQRALELRLEQWERSTSTRWCRCSPNNLCLVRWRGTNLDFWD